MTATTVEPRGDREVVVTREFDAPRELVWTMWTDPAHLPNWYGARGWTLPVCEIDLRVGGAYHFVHAGPDAQRFESRGTYLTVDAPLRLVSTETMDGMPETRVTMTLAEVGGRTRVTLELAYASAEAREQVLATRMAEGLGEGFERLDAYLGGRSPAAGRAAAPLAMKLELVPIPVADLDRAKAFYEGVLGFVSDVDMSPFEGARFCQLTPPSSACSIIIGTGLPVELSPPGSLRWLHLVVADIKVARDELIARGVDVGEITDVGGGVLYAGFDDPDGNTWTLQEMPWRSADFG